MDKNAVATSDILKTFYFEVQIYRTTENKVQKGFLYPLPSLSPVLTSCITTIQISSLSVSTSSSQFYHICRFV